MLKGKIVLLGVTGSIAAYKTASLANVLVKKGVKVHVLMTKNAAHFINPITSESLTGNKCLADTFDRNFEFNVEYVALAKQADAVMIAPASVNTIGKIAHDIVDDMLTTTVMACKCKKVLALVVNANIYENPILQDNLDICRRYGMEVTTSAWGYLACDDIEAGKMPEPEVFYECILREAGHPGDLAGRRVLAIAGPTRESIDPARYITNHSTGKTGYVIARVAAYRGADVTLVSGPVDLPRPLFVETVPVESAREMFKAVTARSGEQGTIVKAMAAADYWPAMVGTEKIKKSDGDSSIVLERTNDTLGWLGQNQRDGQFLCGLSMETQNMLENSRAKPTKKHINMIVANSLKAEDAGFGADTNVVTLIVRDSETEPPIMTKGEIVDCLLTETLKRIKERDGIQG